MRLRPDVAERREKAGLLIDDPRIPAHGEFEQPLLGIVRTGDDEEPEFVGVEGVQLVHVGQHRLIERHAAELAVLLVLDLQLDRVLAALVREAEIAVLLRARIRQFAGIGDAVAAAQERGDDDLRVDFPGTAALPAFLETAAAGALVDEIQEFGFSHGRILV